MYFQGLGHLDFGVCYLVGDVEEKLDTVILTFRSSSLRDSGGTEPHGQC